jgi:hypothetical protein
MTIYIYIYIYIYIVILKKIFIERERGGIRGENHLYQTELTKLLAGTKIYSGTKISTRKIAGTKISTRKKNPGTKYETLRYF